MPFRRRTRAADASRRIGIHTLLASTLGFILVLSAIAPVLHIWFATDWTRAFLTARPFAVISSAVTSTPAQEGVEP